MNINNNRGFTLIEILTVIAIIGVLAAILIPATGKAMESARKAKEASNLRQIALAYMSYSTQSGEAHTVNEPTVHAWIEKLAKESTALTPQIFILSHDPMVQQSSVRVPASFKDPTFRQSPISFAVVNKVSSNANPSTTPIAWTRGLLPSGKWAGLTEKNPGLYGDKGGYVAFMDGHVTWYTDLSENGGQLVHYAYHTPTGNIMEALNPGAEVLDTSGTMRTNTRKH